MLSKLWSFGSFQPVAFQSLEGRTLLSSSAFRARVNFQPASVETPVGYTADTGASFSAKGRGLRYGWDTDLSSATVNRKPIAASDPVFNTFIASQAGNGNHVWQIAVPDGTYTVRIALGDSASTGSFDRINVEGTLFAKGKPSAARPWFSATRKVTVTDGRLTISNAPDARQNAIDFITIDSINTKKRSASAAIPGKTVQAHGGSILYQDGVYYWYGEDKAGPTSTVNGQPHVDVLGVSVYTSTDLKHWTSRGLALEGESTGDLSPSNVVERPKVIYNKANGKYVMWMHIDNGIYSKAKVGVAVSDSPLGPFVYQGSFRPLGLQSRDMTVFQDDDGSAYLVFATDHNHSLRIAPMTPDYLTLTGASSIPFTRQGNREAPQLFKHDGSYYLLTSGTTWFAPNAAQYAVASSVMGPYTPMGNPIRGSGASTTFDSQGAFALQIPGTDDFVLLADRWNESNLGLSSYAWLPIAFNGTSLSLQPPLSLKPVAVT